MDYFAKWPDVNAFPNQKASTMVDVLVTNFFYHFDIPQQLHYDQGQNSKSGYKHDLDHHSCTCSQMVW
jgi:hypothetical protein